MPEKKRKVNYDFFRLSVSGINDDQVHRIFNHRNEFYDKTVNGTGNDICFHTLRKNEYLYSGSLINVHLLNIPGKFNSKSHNLSELPLNNGDGLAYVTAFVFDKELNILMYQSSRSGVSLKGFCEFFELNCNIPSIDTSIVIDTQKAAKFRSLTAISRVCIRVAQINDGSSWANEEMAAADVRELADETNTEYYEYILQAKRKKSLEPSRVKSYIDRLIRRNPDAIEKIIISGKEESETKNSIINLMHTRLQSTLDYTLSRNSDIFVIGSTLDRMEHEYNRRRAYLLRTYGPQ